MTTNYSFTAGARIVDHISQNPIPGLVLFGQADDSRPYSAGDNSADAPARGYRDAATVFFDIAQLTLMAEDGPVRWWLEKREVDEQTGIESFRLVGGGELVSDIGPVIDALRDLALARNL
ncbi:hypothetical protein ACFWPH_27975 [Nocardia sp. NPDC058499]|uniref:hypothetical protein n=1 Tax=Nocardia sp. NPDC058499 TaxID=3346530 RepID=UPI003667C789